MHTILQCDCVWQLCILVSFLQFSHYAVGISCCPVIACNHAVVVTLLCFFSKIPKKQETESIGKTQLNTYWQLNTVKPAVYGRFLLRDFIVRSYRMTKISRMIPKWFSRVRKSVSVKHVWFAAIKSLECCLVICWLVCWSQNESRILHVHEISLMICCKLVRTSGVKDIKGKHISA